MDFIVGLPNTSRHHDSIWVIVDRLTKTAHFLPVHTTHKTEKYAEIYVDQIVRLHGIPKTIISDRGALFVARFWEQLQESLGTQVIRSSAYHPQTNGQTERVNQTAHFLPVHTTHKTEKYAEIYVDQIVRLHGIPKTIISDRGALFVARFWEQLQESLGTQVIRSSAYHPQTNGQTERVNQILEDMLRACVLHYGKDWDKCLFLASSFLASTYHPHGRKVCGDLC